MAFSTISETYVLAHSHLNHSRTYPQLSGMPIKSDGSLCIMEAFSSPQQEILTSSTPKLEDFFSVSSISAHQYQYGNETREAIAPSLDNMYYSQNAGHFQTLEEEMYNPTSHLKGNQSIATEIASIQSCAKRHYTNELEARQIALMSYGDLHALRLSMNTGSQSSFVTVPQISSENVAMDGQKKGSGKSNMKQTTHRKSADTFGQRTSQYRGLQDIGGLVDMRLIYGIIVVRKKDRREKEDKLPDFRFLIEGGYDMEEKAARAYDLAALKYWGPSTHINFPLEDYQDKLEEMKNMSRQEYIAHLRRRSSGFSRGASIYRGVTRHHQHGRWQARIGRVAGNKDLYLGTFSTQEEAAEAYDIAAIKFRGVNAVTNFDICRYDVDRIIASNTLLSGDIARKKKEIEPINENISHINRDVNLGIENPSHSNWKMVLQNSSQPFTMQSISPSIHDLTGIERVNEEQRAYDEPEKLPAEFSNASSLVTSVGSSREGSPDSNPILFAPNHTTNLDSWVPSNELRAPLSTPLIPIFATWTNG